WPAGGGQWSGPAGSTLRPDSHPGRLGAAVIPLGANTPPPAGHSARWPRTPPLPRPAGVAPPRRGRHALPPHRAIPDSAVGTGALPVPWPRGPPGPGGAASGPPRPAPARPAPSRASTAQTLYRAQTPAASPGSGGLPRAPGPLAPRGGSDAGWQPNAGRTPD